MELTFNGHACVTLRSKGRSRTVVTDPYRSGAFGGRIAHKPVVEAADLVTVSHYHVDHSHVTSDLGSPAVADVSGRYAGVDVTAVATYHDRHFGTKMGMTSMFAWEQDGLRIAHLGDLGCDLTPRDLEALGDIDVLLWPVGDVYTVGPGDAAAILAALKPRLAIPLHFENARCQLGMQPIEATLAALDDARIPWTRQGNSTIHAGESRGVVVLEPAL